MDRQDPPTDPAVNLLGVFIMFRQRKRCYDVTLSRQEGSTTRHLASAQSKDRLAGGDTGRLFLTFGGPVSPTGVSNCPLDRVLTYKNLIYLLNLQFCHHVRPGVRHLTDDNCSVNAAPCRLLARGKSLLM